jgi:hypothetical protein
MKINITAPISGGAITLCAFLGLVGLENALLAGEEDSKDGLTATTRGAETQMDLPGSFHKYYGQSVTYYRDGERKVAKLDLDGDLNYDGVISNEDPADNGAFQNTPPGLVVGVGELTKLVLRLTPYRIDYQGDVVVTIEVAGINRAAASGRFASFEEEKASTGRIRVWQDAGKSKLLLDSGRADMLVHEFLMDANKYPANLPGTVPRTLYVEGVSTAGSGGGSKGGLSATYEGDLRVLTTVSNREKGLILREDGKGGLTPEAYTATKRKWPVSFRTTFDHILFTVRERPMRKEFVSNNADGVWINP